MKKLTLLATLLAAAIIPTQAALLITEVYPSGSGNGTYGADWFELTNTGASALDITGWKVDDSSPSFATAVALRGITSIGAGESIVFIEGNTGGTTDATVQASFKTAWFGSSVPGSFKIGGYGGSGIGLSTGSDAINIYNSGGTIVASVSFGATTSGATLDNAAGLNGTIISQVSIGGVHGAFTSFNGAEIGSPGVISAVPEPSTWAIGLAMFAITGAFAVQRRRASARA